MGYVTQNLNREAPMKELNPTKVCEILNRIMEYELAGVVRYTHYSLMVRGLIAFQLWTL